jgi:2,4-dienoyl-CoA reductase-like NADH-dependent reductase (Old Yellow Enzyme family)
MDNSALFVPFNYKSLHMKNRIVMAPMTRSFSPGGVPGLNVAEYYARRAAGNVGLILSEGTVVERPASSNDPKIPKFYSEASLLGWKHVIEGVHKNHGQMAPQIWHMGYIKDEPPFEGPNTMSEKDITDTILAFASAAGSAKKLGFDAVEMHGAHGYLIDQFFFDKMNARTDRYGGRTIAERSRFAVDIVTAIRATVGPDFAIILRLSQWKQQDYAARLASTPLEMEQWLLPLAKAGVDIFHCSQRRFWDPEFESSDLNFAGWAKKITGQPTITVGSVGLSDDFFELFKKGAGADPASLDELIRRFERGDFDLVAVGRALLQDPQWVDKIRAGKAPETFTKKALESLT